MESIEEKKEEKAKPVDPISFPDLNFTPIKSYGWDQKNELVKVYLLTGLDKIG